VRQTNWRNREKNKTAEDIIYTKLQDKRGRERERKREKEKER
jgi:hypothetical protein